MFMPLNICFSGFNSGFISSDTPRANCESIIDGDVVKAGHLTLGMKIGIPLIGLKRRLVNRDCSTLGFTRFHCFILELLDLMIRLRLIGFNATQSSSKCKKFWEVGLLQRSFTAFPKEFFEGCSMTALGNCCRIMDRHTFRLSSSPP